MNIPFSIVSRRSPGRSGLLLGLLGVLALVPAGCNIAGVAAMAMPGPTVPAVYTDLKGKSVAIMVSAPPGVIIDWPSIQLDIATNLQKKLKGAQETAGVAELEKTRFPVTPESVHLFQKNHPELESTSVTDVAPQLGATRVICIELDSFMTRSPESIDLFRGDIVATVRVVAVENGKGKQVLTDSGVHATFPPNSPEEGMPNIGDGPIYVGTLDRFTTVLMNLFVPHPEDK